MAARPKRRPRAENHPIVAAVDLLRALADGDPKIYWHVLAGIGLFAAVRAPSRRDRVRGERLRERCERQGKVIESSEEQEKQAWLRRQLEGLGGGA